MKMTCAKCGDECTRRSNRQKFCNDCSPHTPSTNMPDLTCCHCGSIYGKAKRRNRVYGLNDKPCDNCKAIVERQLTARKIKWARKHKKSMSRWGKHLIELEEKARRDNLECGEDRYEEHLFTRMRYVSEEELNILRDNTTTPSWHYGGDDFWARTGKPILIWRMTGVYGDHDGFIYEPGFYRVEVIEERSDCFSRVCADGIPLSHRNHTNTMIQRMMDAKDRVGNEKWRTAIWLKRQKLTQELRNDARKKQWLRTEPTFSDRQFFNTLAMAEAVSQ